MVSRFSSDEASSTVSPAPLGPARLLVRAPEPAADELVVDEHRNSGCPVSQRAFYPVGLGGRIPWCLVVCVLFPINGARKKPLAVRRCRLWDANVARTLGARRSLDLWAITDRYRLKERSPLMVTIMAMARGGLSSEVKGTSRFHSKRAAASGTIADSCEYICPALRYDTYSGTPPASEPSLSSLTCRVGDNIGMLYSPC